MKKKINRHDNIQVKEVKELKYTFPKVKELNQKKNLFHNAVKICDKKKLNVNKNKNLGKFNNTIYSQNSYSAAKLVNNKYLFYDNKTYNKSKNLKKNISTESFVNTYTKSTKKSNYIITVTTTITEIPNQDTDEGILCETRVRCPHIEDDRRVYHTNCLADFNNFENRNRKNNIRVIRKIICPIHGKSTWTYKEV